MSAWRERLERTWTRLRATLRELRRTHLLWPPLAAGFFFTGEAARGYPASYLFVPDPSVLVVQIATWAWLVAQGLAVAALFAVPVALFSREAPPATTPRPKRGLALPLLGLTALAALLRGFWSDLIPPEPWWDGIFAIDDAARAGRFVGLHEAIPLGGAGPKFSGAPVLIYGGYLDFVRALLHLCPDRPTVHLLMNLLPSALVPAALVLLARRLTTERAALAAGFLCAVTPWPLILARWGWDQQAMTLLVLLAVERVSAGLEARRPGPLFLGGLLAGAACHTYIAGLIATGALALWVVAETRGRRALAFLGGVALLAAPLLLVYRHFPAGGRVTSEILKGTPLAILRTLAVNAFVYGGELFFTPEPLARHGLVQQAHQSVPLVALFVIGLGALLARRGFPVAARGTVLLFLVSLAGGILSDPRLAPNGYRTGLAGVLALVAAGEGLASVTESRRFSEGFRRVAPAAAGAAFLAFGLSTLVAWALMPQTEFLFSEAGRIGRFAAIAGPDRVVVDLRLVFWNHPSYHGAAFFVRAGHPLEPLRPIRYELPPAAGLASLRADWFVTNRESPDLPGVELSAPGHPFAGLRAVNLKRLRSRTPAPG